MNKQNEMREILRESKWKSCVIDMNESMNCALQSQKDEKSAFCKPEKKHKLILSYVNISSFLLIYAEFYI